MSRALALLILAFLAGQAHGQSPGSGPCWRAAQTQADLRRCADEDARAARARLDRLLVVLRRTLDERAHPGLEQSQQSWRAYAKSHCGWDGAAFEGGSIQPLIVLGCLTAITEQRIATLKPYLCGWPPESPDCEAARAFEKP